MNYEEINFKAGIEIHQQIDTHKLFCNCQSIITEDIDYSFERILRPTQSELGDIDRAALEESKKKRRFLYTASAESTCLVEADEEPPHSANGEAIDICLTMTALMDAKPVDEIHFMRKIVIDGSNTSGFQRTGLIAVGGKINDVGIQTIAVEEDAARKLEEKGKLVTYGLDRLGIPLIEIATDPDIKNPKQVKDIAEQIGLLLRATGKVKRGLGTIRQDLNISVLNGSRVEIKGVQMLKSISKVAEKEVLRQLEIVKIKEILEKRIKPADLENIEVYDITKILEGCNSDIIKKLIKNGCAKSIKLPGFAGMLKKKDSRLGREFAVHARSSSGLGGIIHSDEFPGYGLKNEEIEKIKNILNTGENDAFVIAIGKEEIADKAINAVTNRARMTLEKGVVGQVRRALLDDSTEYMRPLPGAARMYPETDVQPIRITKEKLEKIKGNLPERPEEKRERFVKQYKLNKEQTKQILSSGYENDFERLVKKFPDLKNTIIRTFLNTFSELEKEEIIIDSITETLLIDVFSALSEGKYSKEAIPEILRYLSGNFDKTVGDAIKACGFSTTDAKELQEIVKKIVNERVDFVRERGISAIGPLMGIVMKELRGKADGKKINEALKKEIEKVL
ncbi:MAG: Glu-tRNA(Gln) amidotransferase subunit GatE [Candidatus Thermoplasmatota archaeon]|nr:Glu-tRNA(Gln) amidotransferase subunit GatE [Candidatus Thermoplasmatota archaeon]